MSISKDLFLAILSMDSYNREYGAGLVVSGDQVGLANLVPRETVGIGEPEYVAWQSAGFYAAAYELQGAVG